MSYPTGDAYDARFAALAAEGADVHGEANLVEALADGQRLLDAGCGTGRVAVELARRGFEVTGVDVDPAMLDTARTKPEPVEWLLGDLAEVELEAEAFDLVVMAGNVLLFTRPGTEAAVVANLAPSLRTGGLLVAGFSLQPGRYGGTSYDLATYDRHCTLAGLELVERWATWDRQPFVSGGDYAVSLHRRAEAG